MLHIFVQSCRQRQHMNLCGAVRLLLSLLAGALIAGRASAIDLTRQARQVDVYPYPVEGGLSMSPDGPESRRFCGWPANGKAFAWGDELLVVFTYAPAGDGTGSGYHATGPGRSYRWSMRSRDGGETWTDRAADGAGLVPGEDPVPLPGPIDFSEPDLALLVLMTGSQSGPARILYSRDRGRRWNGYFAFPAPGFNPVAARSDYIVEDSRALRVFASAGFDGDEDGTTPYQWITRDGGMSWRLLGRTGLDVVNQAEWAWSIMPATVRLSDGMFVQTARTKGTGRPFVNFHPVHRSGDGGRTWEFTGAVFKEDPPRGGEGLHTPSDLDLIPGTDTLVCTYVERSSPSRVLAKLSEDGGLSWGEEILLRADGGGHDVGYPETVFRADGKAVTVVYWYLRDDPKSWSKEYDPRFLAVLIWDPRSAVRR